MIMPQDMTRGQKFAHYAKISVVHILIFAAIAGILYGHMTVQTSQKEQALQEQRIADLQAQVDLLKK